MEMRFGVGCLLTAEGRVYEEGGQGIPHGEKYSSVL